MLDQEPAICVKIRAKFFGNARTFVGNFRGIVKDIDGNDGQRNGIGNGIVIDNDDIELVALLRFRLVVLAIFHIDAPDLGFAQIIKMTF